MNFAAGTLWLRGPELRTPIYITGGMTLADDPDKASRVVFIDHFAIHNGLPEPEPYDDGFGVGYVAEDECAYGDALA